MEIRKHLDLRKLLAGIYILALAVYFAVGFMPADATNYDISAELSIPSIGLYSDVTKLSLKNHQLETPRTIVGSFTRNSHKTLLIGHSTTVFNKLDEVKIGDEIVYDDTIYYIYNMYTVKKEEIKMGKLLSGEEKDTIVLMTCTGEPMGELDATHRLIVWASREPNSKSTARS